METIRLICCGKPLPFPKWLNMHLLPAGISCVKSKNLLRFREPSLFAALSELHDDFDKDKTNTSLLVRIRASLALVPVQSSAKIGLKPPD
jgi:hypothetical protein